MSDRNLFCVDTPYQLFMSSLIAGKELESGTASDVVVFENFRDAGLMAQSAERAGLFSNVWTLPPFSVDAKRRVGTAEAIGLTLHPKESADRIRTVVGDRLQSYSRYYCSVMTAQTLSVHRAMAPHTPTTIFDDGSGTYNGAIGQMITAVDGVLRVKYLAMQPDSMRLIAKRVAANLFNAASFGRYRLGVDSLLVWAPSEGLTSVYSKRINICAMPSISAGINEAVANVFIGKNAKCYQKARGVFFLSPYINDALARLEQEAVQRASDRFGTGLIVRPHPRSNYSGEITGPFVLDDDGQTGWEMLVASGLLSEGVTLMGVGSSALMAPKRLLGKEPNLIYLCNMMEGDENMKHRFCQEASAAAVFYEDKKKVCTPDSMDIFMKELASL